MYQYFPKFILHKLWHPCIEDLLVQLVQHKVDNIWNDFDVAISADIVGHVHGKFPGYWHMVLKE